MSFIQNDIERINQSEKKSFYRKSNVFFLNGNYCVRISNSDLFSFLSLEKEPGHYLNSWEIERKFSINKIKNEYEYYYFH